MHDTKRQERDERAGRKAKFYTLTKAGRRQLAREEESWDLLALDIAKVGQAT